MAGTATQPKRRRWIRRTVWSVVGVVIAVVLGIFILTRSFVLSPIVESALADALGGDVSIGSTRLNGFGGLTVGNVVVRSRELSGDAAEIIRAESVRVRAPLLDLITGNADRLDVHLVRPVFRVSEDVDDPNEFTFLSLGGSGDGGPGETWVVVGVEDGVIEVGEHQDDRFVMNGQLRVGGTLHTREDRDNTINFEIHELDTSGAPKGSNGMLLKGSMDTTTLETQASVSGVQFDDRTRDMFPRLVRDWWARLELDGRIEVFRAWISRDDGIRAELEVKDLGITIPLPEPDRIWSRYVAGERVDAEGLPRMHISEGRIEFADQTVHFRAMRGAVVSTVSPDLIASVPYEIAGTLGPLPAFARDKTAAWSDRAVRLTPLALRFVLRDFQYDDASTGANSILELPRPVTGLLEKFRLRAFTLDTEVSVVRDVTTDENGSQIATFGMFGRASITGGRGAYFKVPYPLEDVSTNLTFDQNEVHVEHLTGTGPNGGALQLTGVVAPLDTRYPNVDLRLRAQNVPVDAILKDSLPDHLSKTVAMLFHEPSYEALSDAGVLPNAESLAAARDQIEALQELKDDDNTKARVDAMKRVISDGPFELGGEIGLDLHITRREGENNNTSTVGTIIVEDVNLLIDHFPVPLFVQNQRVEIDDDGVVLAGVAVTTAGGGTGRVDGTVRMVKDESVRDVIPDLTMTVGEMISTPVFAEAIALAGNAPLDETPDGLATARDLLAAANLDALIAADGQVTHDGNDTQWVFEVRVADGSLTPTEQLPGLMRSAGLFWPGDFPLANVNGSLTINREMLRFDQFGGQRGPASVTLNRGLIGFGSSKEREFDIVGEHLPVESSLISLFDDSTAASLRDLWATYQPDGSFSMNLEARAHPSNDTSSVSILITPHDLVLHADGGALIARGVDDSPLQISVTDQMITFDDVVLDLFEPRAELVEPTRFQVEGTVARDVESKSWSVSGQVTRGDFASEWLSEALKLLGLATWNSERERYNLSGTYRMSFNASGERGQDAPSFAVVVNPETAAFMYNDVPFNLALASPTRIEIQKDEVRVNRFVGTAASGATFDVSGRVSLPGLTSDIVVTYTGDPLNDEARAFVPQAVHDSLSQINFVHRGATLRNASVHLERSDHHEPKWLPSFNGTVELKGAEFVAGLPFHDLHGRVHIDTVARPDAPPKLALTARADRALARGRRLTDARLTMVLTEDGSRLLIPEAYSKLAGGRATASGFVGVETESPYEIVVEVVGANLQDLSTTRDSSSIEAESTTVASSDGVVYARFGVEGVKGKPEEKRGRASVRVMDGTLARNPITLPLVQLTQFMLPIDASLDYAEVSMFLVGDRGIIDHALFEGDRILFRGAGEIDLEDFEVNLLLRTRGRMIGLSDVVANVSDQIYAVSVTGPLHDTQARLVPVPAVGDLLDAVLRSGNRSPRVDAINSRSDTEMPR